MLAEKESFDLIEDHFGGMKLWMGASGAVHTHYSACFREFRGAPQGEASTNTECIRGAVIPAADTDCTTVVAGRGIGMVELQITT